MLPKFCHLQSNLTKHGQATSIIILLTQSRNLQLNTLSLHHNTDTIIRNLFNIILSIYCTLNNVRQKCSCHVICTKLI